MTRNIDSHTIACTPARVLRVPRQSLVRVAGLHAPSIGKRISALSRHFVGLGGIPCAA